MLRKLAAKLPGEIPSILKRKGITFGEEEDGDDEAMPESGEEPKRKRRRQTWEEQKANLPDVTEMSQ